MARTATRLLGLLALAALTLGCSGAGGRSRAWFEGWRQASAPSAEVAAPTAAPPQPSASPLASPYRLTAAQEHAGHPENLPPVEGSESGVQPSAPRPAAPGLPRQGQPLSLVEIEQLACQNNPTLLQARSQVDGELGRAIQAGLWPNPTLAYVQEQIGVEGTAGEFVGGVVRQRFVTAHKLDLSEAKYLALAETAEWHALEQQYRVLNDVRMHYFRARGRYELLQIHRDLLENAEDGLLTTQEQFNVGQATQADVHLANVARQRARLDLMQAENDYHEALNQLMALAGVSFPTASLSTGLEGNLAPLSWDDTLAHLLTESPQLQAARTKLESDRITVARERAEPWPDIVLEGGAGYNNETDQTVGEATISLDVPIFDRNQGTIQQAQADYVRQQGEYRRVELELQRELARVYRDYLTAQQHAALYQQVILPDARAAYELQLRSYQEDRIDWQEVLHTQQDYFMLRAEYVRQLIAWRENEVLLTGFLLHDGLMAPSAPPPPGHIDAVPKPR